MSRFVKHGDMETTIFDWGSAGMRAAPPTTGCTSFVVMDVRLAPGAFHAFHRHPDQDEIVGSRPGGSSDSTSSARTRRARPGRLGVHRSSDVVHASYNDLDEPVDLQT